MRLSLCEAPTQKEQHNGQPQHRETSRPTLFFNVGSLTSHIERINMAGIVRRIRTINRSIASTPP